MASNAIDLDQAEQAVSTLIGSSNDERQQQKYRPKTMKPDDLRDLYLPLFPTDVMGSMNDLLLANVLGSFASAYLATAHLCSIISLGLFQLVT